MIFRSAFFRGNGRLAATADGLLLRKGDKGRAVRLIQQALLDLGYKLPTSTIKFGSPDGIYGSETKAAVRKFQTDEKLGWKDGIVGEQTLRRLDEVLVSRKVPFKQLPPLPPGSPGDQEDEALDARQAVLETLAFNPFRGTTFSLRFRQTIEGNAIDEEAHVAGRHYDSVAQAVADGTIQVEVHPKLTRLALYLSSVPDKLTQAQRSELSGLGLTSLPNANTLVLKRPMSQSRLDRSVIFHEATHAVCDLQKGGSMNALFAEMLATVAEAMFFRKTGGSIAATNLAKKADKVAALILAGKDPEPEMRDFALNMRADPDHARFTHGTYVFDGIS